MLSLLGVAALSEITVEPLPNDLVAQAHVIVIEAEAFPRSNVPFGLTVRERAAPVLIARRGGEIVGYVATKIRGRHAHVLATAVAPSHRGSGVGHALIRAAAADARTRGARAMALEVATTNEAAIALYRAEGFSMRRLRRHFYPAAYGFGTTD